MSTDSRRLTAIMFTDIVGYSRLMAVDEQHTLEIVRQQRAVLIPLIEAANGTLHKEIGDGTLSTFTSAVDALNCARAIQQRIHELNTFRIRIGLHVGDVAITEGDVYGDGVNIAARIEPLAAPGGIAFSESFHAALRGQPDLQLRSLGRRRVKNIVDPIGIYTLAGDPTASAWRRARRLRAAAFAAGVFLALLVLLAIWHGTWPDWAQRVPAQDHSVAVLPFENLSGREEDAFLSEGFSDELRDQLSQVKGIRVVARASSIAFRGSEEDAKDIAGVLGVAAVVEGSLRKEEDRIRVSVRLVDGGRGLQLWSQSFDRKLGDMFAAQQEVAVAAAQQILPQLSPAEVQAPRWQASVHELMLLARSYQENAFAPRDQDKVIEIYRQVIKSDPKSAAAHARIGKALLLQGQDLAAAEKHVQRALALDPDLAEAHTIMGLILWSQYRKGAGAEYQRAVELNPNDAEAAHFYSEYLGLQRKDVQQRIYLQRAADLDPMSLWHNADLGWTSALIGDVQGAEKAMAVIEQRFPGAAGRHALSRIANAAGKLDEAVAWSLEALRLEPTHVEAAQDLAQLYARLGMTEESRHIQADPKLAVLFWERRYADIIALMTRQDLNAADPDALGYLAFALQAVGRDAEAISVLKAMSLPEVALDDDLRRWAAVNHLATLTGSLKATGSTQEAKRLAVWLEGFFFRLEQPERLVSGYGWGAWRWQACALAVQDKHEQALAAFEEAVRAPNLAWLPFLLDSGCLGPMRSEPRYQNAISMLEARHHAIRTRLPETLARHGLTTDGAGIKSSTVAPAQVEVRRKST